MQEERRKRKQGRLHQAICLSPGDASLLGELASHPVAILSPHDLRLFLTLAGKDFLFRYDTLIRSYAG